MQFYVPTIGDKVYLTQPWTFTLHRENRNSSLALKIGQAEKVKHIIPHRLLKCIKKVPATSIGLHFSVSRWEVGDTVKVLEENLEEALRIYGKDYWEDAGPANPDTYTTNEWNAESKLVTLPINTKLCIDRIYIRGKGEDCRNYDSITFYIDDCPNKDLAPKKVGGKSKGRIRFWVKLKDANKIVCQLHPVVDQEAYERMKNLDLRFSNLELE